MVKGDRLQICSLQVQILSLSQNLEVLSNWLAHQTVNLVSSERVGSSPTTSTKSIYGVIGSIVDLAHALFILEFGVRECKAFPIYSFEFESR